MLRQQLDFNKQFSHKIKKNYQNDDPIYYDINQDQLDTIRDELHNLQTYSTQITLLSNNVLRSSRLLTENNVITSQEEKDILVDQYHFLYKYLYHLSNDMNKLIMTLQQSINNNINILIPLKKTLEDYYEYIFKIDGNEYRYFQHIDYYERKFDKIKSFGQTQSINLEDLGLNKKIIPPIKSIDHLTSIPYVETSHFTNDTDLNSDIIIKSNKPKNKQSEDKEFPIINETIQLDKDTESKSVPLINHTFDKDTESKSVPDTINIIDHNISISTPILEQEYEQLDKNLKDETDDEIDIFQDKFNTQLNQIHFESFPEDPCYPRGDHSLRLNSENQLQLDYTPPNLEIVNIHDNEQIQDYTINGSTIIWGPQSIELFNKVCTFFDKDNPEFNKMTIQSIIIGVYNILCSNLLPQTIYCYVIDKTKQPIKFKLATEHDKLIITNAFEEIMMIYLSNDKYFELNNHTEIISTWNTEYPELLINIM